MLVFSKFKEKKTDSSVQLSFKLQMMKNLIQISRKKSTFYTDFYPMETLFNLLKITMI